MNNYDEILDCIFGLGQIINEQGPSSVNIEGSNAQTVVKFAIIQIMISLAVIWLAFAYPTKNGL